MEEKKKEEIIRRGEIYVIEKEKLSRLDRRDGTEIEGCIQEVLTDLKSVKNRQMSPVAFLRSFVVESARIGG